MVTLSLCLTHFQVIWHGLWTLTLKWFTFCLTIYTFCVRVIEKDIWKTSSIFLLYYFSLNCQNYARNLSYCCVYMWALEEKNIAAYKYLEQGGFSGSLTGKPHSRIPFDQVIKMTINRSCKDIGGLSRNTQNPGATERRTKIHHHLSLILPESNEMKKMWGIS